MRGVRLDDYIGRLAYQPIALQASIYQAWPSAANPISIPQALTWTQVIAAGPSTGPFTVFLSGRAIDATTDGNPRGFIELGVGAVGSEVAVAGTWYQNCTQGYYFFEPAPVIPAGSRVSLRMPSGTVTTYGSLISALLPPRRPIEQILRLVPKYASPLYYPGGSGFWNTTQGIQALGGTTAWAFGAWAEVFNSTVEVMPLLLTHVYINSSDNNFEGQLEFGYGGVDGAANAPAATWGQFTIGYPQGGATYTHYVKLPTPILWTASTRLTIRFADQGGVVDSVIAGVSGLRLPYYP